MEPPAGLIGRDEELRAVRTALDGRGCVIAGPAGVGKTRLADDAIAGIGPGRSVVRVVATTSARALPFGAVSHLLPGADSPTIAGFLAALRDGALGPRPTVFVDDAQWLDEASAALVLAMATSEVAPLLLTLRSSDPAPGAVVRLWRERHLDRVDLQPLSTVEVEALVDALLGAPSHAQAYEWIHRLAEGNPLFVTELVDDGRRSGRLELRDGRWRLVPGHTPFDRLHDLLGAHLSSVTGAAREAMELLALGAPMPLALVEGLVPGPELEELERSRLAVVRDDPRLGPLVDLAHPLFGELLRSSLPETAARRARRALAGALARHGSDTPAERLRIAQLLLDSGRIDEDRFLDASSIAIAQGAPELALRLAGALPPSLPAVLNVARALAGTGRHDEVDAMLAPFEASAFGADPALATAYFETRVRSLLGGPGDQPERARALVTRVETWRDDPDWRALMATARCWIAVRNGAYATAWDLVEGSLADPAVSAERRRALLLAYRLVLPRLCRVDDHEAVLDEVAQLTEQLGGSRGDVAMNHVHREGGRVAAGRDLNGVRARLQGHLDRAKQRGEPFEHIGLLYLLAGVAHHQGHHTEARSLYQRTLDHLADGDAYHLVPAAQLDLSISLSYLGEERPARRAMEQARAEIDAKPGLGPQFAQELAHAAAMVELAAGRESSAREQLLAVAASCGDDVLLASIVVHAALLLGAHAGSCASRLEELARDAQDDAVHLRSRHARAVADRDPAGQLAAAEGFEAAGLDLDAAQAGATAAAAFVAAGLRREASGASTLAARCAGRCPGVKVPALAVRPEVQELTPREREIATLAARGASNPEIAEALTLSQRTVETYVLRAYRKLGVNNRRGLAAALDHDRR